MAHRQGRVERYVYAGGGASYQSWLQLVASDVVRQTVREGSKVPPQARLVDGDKRIGRRKQDHPRNRWATCRVYSACCFTGKLSMQGAV